ncbi:hypothetical protein GCM10028791_02000 [Echinicola sediminis]
MEISKATELNNEGVQHFLNGNFEKAGNCYREAFKLNPQNPSLLNNLGLFYHHQKQFDDALDYFEKAIEQEDKPSYIINSGNTLAMLGKLQEAEKRYRLAAEKYPDHANAWLSLAKLSTHKNELDKAKIYWNTLLNLEAKLEYFVELAKVFLLQKDYEGALKILHDLTASDDHPEIWFHIGRCEFHLRNHGLAEKAFKKALADLPDQPDFRYYLATNYLGMGNIEEGLKQLNILLKMNPENPLILTEKGVILCSMHQYDDALLLFNKALSIQPDFAKALHYKKLIENQTS